jgi:hypothetical protein
MPIDKKYWKKEMAKLVKLARLNTDDPNHISPILVEELLFDIPDCDMSKQQKKKWYDKLHEKK